MGDNPFRHVRGGEPLVIPATAYNAMVDAAQVARNRRMNLAPHGAGFESLFVHVVNTTGKELRRFDVVGLDGPLITDDFDALCERMIFKGVVPKAEHQGKFAVIQEDASKDQCVRACVIGVTVARIKVEEESDDLKTCVIAENETQYLKIGTEGAASVLWIESGRGEKRALILLGGTAAAQSDRYGIVMKTVRRPSDLEQEVPDGRGEIRLLGKNYPTDPGSGEKKYDPCACTELVGDEVLPPGARVKATGPFSGKEGDETVQWYEAVETKGEYAVKLLEDLESGGTSKIKLPTIRIGSETPEEFECEVEDAVLKRGELYYEGDPVYVKRQGDKLVVYDGPCAGRPEDQ